MEGSPAASGVPHPQDRLDCSRLAEVVGPRQAGTTSPVLAPVHAASCSVRGMTCSPRPPKPQAVLERLRKPAEENQGVAPPGLRQSPLCRRRPCRRAGRYSMTYSMPTCKY
ncbi:hypothetical protein ACQJBY_027624 [Aegilops geniculata]